MAAHACELGCRDASRSLASLLRCARRRSRSLSSSEEHDSYPEVPESLRHSSPEAPRDVVEPWMSTPCGGGKKRVTFELGH